MCFFNKNLVSSISLIVALWLLTDNVSAQVGFQNLIIRGFNGFEWQFLRNPIAENHSLVEREGSLGITASPYIVRPKPFLIIQQKYNE